MCPQYPQGTLSIDLIDASSYDQTHIISSASLGGTLTVTGNPPGQSFTILTAADMDGTFAQLNFPEEMTVVYTATSVILQSAPGVPCPVDIAPSPSGDGAVNVDDLLALNNAWGACADCPADINCDDAVNVDDLLAVINNWG